MFFLMMRRAWGPLCSPDFSAGASTQSGVLFLFSWRVLGLKQNVRAPVCWGCSSKSGRRVDADVPYESWRKSSCTGPAPSRRKWGWTAKRRLACLQLGPEAGNHRKADSMPSSKDAAVRGALPSDPLSSTLIRDLHEFSKLPVRILVLQVTTWLWQFRAPFQTTHLGNLEDVSVIWTRGLWVSECPGLQKVPIDKPERWDVREQREAGTAGSCSSAAFEKPPGGPWDCRLGTRQGRATLATLTEPNDLGGPSHRCLNQPYQPKRDCLANVGRGIHRVDDKSRGCPPVIWIPTGRGQPGLNCHFPTSFPQRHKVPSEMPC